MRVEYVIDAPHRRKWFVVPTHPISQWARPGFYPKKVAEYLLGELGLFRDEIMAVLRVAQKCPAMMTEIKHER
jgi:hypothetical protein